MSGRNGTPGERVYPQGTVGSNPTLSASFRRRSDDPRFGHWTRQVLRANISQERIQGDGERVVVSGDS